MKVNESCYHGCNYERAKKLLDLQKGISSIGDNHWLGDGFYLYEEKLYAYYWIKNMFKNNNKHYEIDDKTSIEEFFKILLCSYEVDESRIFDLGKAKTKMFLDDVREKVINKMRKENAKFNNRNINEGLILNILFNKKGLDSKFDLVVATFNRRYYKYKKARYKFRINTLPEKQICIKNQEIIKKIEENSYIKEKEQLESLVKNINKCIIA